MAEEHQARVTGRDLPISLKNCIEIGNFIRGNLVKDAKAKLEKVAKKEVAVPMRRFNFDRGHKRGRIGAGKYPVKTSREIIKLLKSVEANAQQKGLATDNLFIKEFIPNKGSTQWHYGRKRRRQMKRTNINLVVEEREPEKEQKPKKEAKAEEKPKEEQKKPKENGKEE